MLKTVAKALGILLSMLQCACAASSSPDTIKVGILHSLSGTMAISETIIKDVLLMLIKEQNQQGGLLGRKLEPLLVDPASNPELFAKECRKLLTEQQAAVIFGCWTSASRKAVLPVLEELNGLLFYPVQYEGEESSRQVIYTGATPNQQSIPAVDYLKRERGVERWVLAGTDYCYPHAINHILISYLHSQGVKNEDILVSYTPFGLTDWKEYIARYREFGSTGRETAVLSTLNGDVNVPFYQEIIRQQVTADQLPVMAFSVSEEELTDMEPARLKGHLSAWNYFQSLKHPVNEKFVKIWHKWTHNDQRVTNDPLESTYIGFKLWVQAVEKAGSTDVDKVLEAIVGLETPNLSGGTARVLPNHHITKPVYIGEIQEDGQFKVVWQSEHEIDGDAWSDYLPASKDLIADWTAPVNCGKFNRVTGQCLDPAR